MKEEKGVFLAALKSGEEVVEKKTGSRFSAKRVTGGFAWGFVASGFSVVKSFFVVFTTLRGYEGSHEQQDIIKIECEKYLAFERSTHISSKFEI